MVRLLQLQIMETTYAFELQIQFLYGKRSEVYATYTSRALQEKIGYVAKTISRVVGSAGQQAHGVRR